MEKKIRHNDHSLEKKRSNARASVVPSSASVLIEVAKESLRSEINSYAIDIRSKVITRAKVQAEISSIKEDSTLTRQEKREKIDSVRHGLTSAEAEKMIAKKTLDSEELLTDDLAVLFQYGDARKEIVNIESVDGITRVANIIRKIGDFFVAQWKKHIGVKNSLDEFAGWREVGVDFYSVEENTVE